VVDHGVITTAKFFEDEIICRFKVPNYGFTNNNIEWWENSWSCVNVLELNTTPLHPHIFNEMV